MKDTRKWLALALAAAVVCGGASSIAATTGDSVEIVIGQTRLDANGDIDGVDDTGNAYAAAWDNVFGRTGRFSGNIGLSRIDAFDNTQVGAWSVDLRARLNIGDNTTSDGTPPGRFRAYLGAGLGGVWSDAIDKDNPVMVDDAWTNIETTESDQFLRFSAVAGARLFMNTERTIGVGFEAELGKPINGGVDVEGSASGKVFLILPAAPTP